MNEFTYFFDVKSISLSTHKGKKPCSLLLAAKHNCRELNAELGAFGHIDPARSKLNAFVIGPNNAAEIAAHAKDDFLVPDRAGKPPRYDHCQAIELVFSLPPNIDRDVRPFFIECVVWAKKTFAGHAIYSAVIHYDEGPPHCHVLISPIRYGRRIGSSVIDRPSLAVLYDKFWCEVAAPNGLAMPPPTMKGERKRKAIQRVMTHLQQERLPCTESLLWPVFESAISSNTAKALHLLDLHISRGQK